jgi:hypothetical protein
MQNIISFVNEQRSWERASPHRRNCHDPPYAIRMGLYDNKSPPRRLTSVERSDPWQATPAQVVFPGDATWRRRLPWAVGSDGWNTGRGKDCQRRYLRGEDCHPEQEICALARLGVAKIEVEGFAFACAPNGYFVSHGALGAGLTDLNVGSVLLWFAAGPMSSPRQSEFIKEGYSSAVAAHEMFPAGGHKEIPHIAVIALVSCLLREIHFGPLVLIISTNAPASVVIRSCLSLSRYAKQDPDEPFGCQISTFNSGH